MSDRMTDARVALLTQTARIAAVARDRCGGGWVVVSLQPDPGNHCCVLVSAVWDEGEMGERVRWHGPLCTDGTAAEDLVDDLGRRIAVHLRTTRTRERLAAGRRSNVSGQ